MLVQFRKYGSDEVLLQLWMWQVPRRGDVVSLVDDAGNVVLTGNVQDVSWTLHKDVQQVIIWLGVLMAGEEYGDVG